MTFSLTCLAEAQREIAQGALFVVNDSGGKDSQAMAILVGRVVPKAQLLVVHASLGDVEWPGALECAQEHARILGAPFIVARAPKTFFELVDHRFRTYPGVPAFPSASNRQCTSDLKRDPIEREVRRHAKAQGFARIVTCMGLRAAESPRRSKMVSWKQNTRQTIAARNWFEWLPIHALTTTEVFETIREAGQQPHPAYAQGNERLSCVFCILGSASDARHGAIRNPDLYERFVSLEERVGFTAHQSRKTLVQLTGFTVAQARAENARMQADQIGGRR